MSVDDQLVEVIDDEACEDGIWGLEEWLFSSGSPPPREPRPPGTRRHPRASA